jgi:tetratricopeptide (TPR) repeat protein
LSEIFTNRQMKKSKQYINLSCQMFLLLSILITSKTINYAQNETVNDWLILSEKAANENKPEESIKFALSSYQLAQKTANPLQIGTIAKRLGSLYQAKSDLTPAIEYYTIAIQNLEKSNQHLLHARALVELGRIFQGQRKLNEALAFYYQAMGIYNQKLNNETAEKNLDLKALILERTTVLLTNQKQYDQAEKYGLESIALAEKIGNIVPWEKTTTAIGNVYFWKKEYEKARNYYQKGYELSLKIGRNAGRNLNNLAMISSKLNNPQKSIEYYKQAIKEYQRDNEWEMIAQTYLNMGGAQINMGDIQMGIDNVQRGVDTLLKYKVTFALDAGYENLVDGYSKLGNYKKALECQKLYIAVKDSMAVKNEKRIFSEWQTKFDVLQKDKEIELLAEESKVQTKENVILRGVVGQILVIFAMLAGFFWYRQRSEKARILLENSLQDEATQRRLNETELKALRAQMNPHFIFNCLNSIKSLILKNETDRASRYLSKFSRLMRQVLENSRNEWVSLHDELETLTLYAEMEKLRFQNKLDFLIKVPPELNIHAIQVPPMLIQPYLENAIWHGLMHKAEGGEVKISLIEKDDNLLEINVIDNGVGRKRAAELESKSTLNQKSHGMDITSERLEMLNRLYKVNASATVTDLYDDVGNETGTWVKLILPI